MSYQRLEVMGMAALHNVILPLAWLQTHLETPKRDECVDYTSAFCDLAELLADLLQRVCSQSMAGVLVFLYSWFVDDIQLFLQDIIPPLFLACKLYRDT